MAQAQFIGPTGAELSQQGLQQFLQGMNQLSEFGRFATEQNRLNKIEKIKNTTADFLLRAQREGGGPGMEWKGIKKIAEQTPEFYENYLKTIEMDPKLAKEMVAYLASNEPTTDEFAKKYVESMQKLGPEIPKPPEAPIAGTQAAEPQKTAGGQPQNLTAWDLAAEGKLGPEAQAAQKFAMGLSEKYKGRSEPEDQGTPDRPRLMNFTSTIADKLLAGLPAEAPTAPAVQAATPTAAASTAQSFYEFLAKDPEMVKKAGMQPVVGKEEFDKWPAGKREAYLKNLVSKAPNTFAGKGPVGKQYLDSLKMGTERPMDYGVAGSPPAGIPLAAKPTESIGAPPGAGTPPPLSPREEILRDKEAYNQAIQLIDEARKSYTGTQAQFGGYTPSEQATAATHANMQRPQGEWVLETGAKGYPEGTVPSASAKEAMGEPKTGQIPSAKASQELAKKVPTLDKDKDLRMAQSYSAKLKKAVTSEAFNALAQENPEEARAFARWQAQDEAYQASLMMYMNPVGEVEYQRNKKSGLLDAQVQAAVSNATLALKQVELLPEALAVEREVAKARIKEAEASMVNSANSVEVSRAQVQVAWADVDRARLMGKAADFDATYAPLKDSTKSYNDAVQQYVNYVRSVTDTKGNLPADQRTVMNLNLLIDNINNQVTALNAAGRGAMPDTWASWTFWPNVELKNVSKWWQINRGYFEIGSAGITPPGGVPPSTPSAPAVTPPGAQAEDEILKDFGYGGSP